MILGVSADNARAALAAYQSDAGDFADVMRAYVDDLDTRLDYIRLRVERAQSYALLANLGGISR
jgi:outer membrane protein TolC